MSAARQLIILQLWIDDNLHVEQSVNGYVGPAGIATAANVLYASYKSTIGLKPWFIVRVGVQSKMNGKFEQYALEVEPMKKLKSAA